MSLRALFVSLVAGFVWLLTGLLTPPAIALTQVRLFDLSYHECPAEIAQGQVLSGDSSRANCFIITGKAENTSGKPVINADIFGRIYDANNDNVMQNRNRLGSIDEVQPGISDFELRVTIATNQPPPFRLEQFKAAGFTGKVRR
jgi:hypothetical protein